MRTPSLDQAVAPTVLYSLGKPTAVLTTPVFTLNDAKMSLQMEVSDTDEDTKLNNLISQGISEIEQITGQELATRNMIAEFETAYDWCVGMIDSNDVEIEGIYKITRNENYDPEGSGDQLKKYLEVELTSTEYEVFYANGRTLFRLTDSDNEFQGGDGVTAKVKFTKGITATSKKAELLSACLRHYVVGNYNHSGTTIGFHTKDNPSFMNALKLLGDSTDYSKYDV